MIAPIFAAVKTIRPSSDQRQASNRRAVLAPKLADCFPREQPSLHRHRPPSRPPHHRRLLGLACSELMGISSIASNARRSDHDVISSAADERPSFLAISMAESPCLFALRSRGSAPRSNRWASVSIPLLALLIRSMCLIKSVERCASRHSMSAPALMRTLAAAQ